MTTAKIGCGDDEGACSPGHRAECEHSLSQHSLCSYCFRAKSLLTQSSSYKAQNAIIDLKEEELRGMIEAQKAYAGYVAGQLGGGGITSGNTTNTEFPKSIYEISQDFSNPVVKKFDEESPYDPMAKYDELFKDGLPNKAPSSPEEMEENLNYYYSTVLQNKIDQVESAGSMAKKGVFGGGVSARGVAGGSGSVGLYEVHDNKGNNGLLITTGAGGGAGLSKSIVVDTIVSPEMDSIYDLEGASLTQGGSLNLGLLSAGYDNVKPITENGEELPAVHSVAFGLNLPSPKLGANVPVEYHAEGGKAWLIPLGNNNPDYIIRSNMIEDLEEQLERYNNE